MVRGRERREGERREREREGGREGWRVQKVGLSSKARIDPEISAFSVYHQNIAINKSFLFLNQSCSNLNYALPDMPTTTPENFRQNGAGTWEEIDHIQTYRQTTRISPPLSHARIMHTPASCTLSSNFFYPSPSLRSALG